MTTTTTAPTELGFYWARVRRHDDIANPDQPHGKPK